MSIGKEFKRIKGKVKEKTSQFFRTSSATVTTLSLPNVSVTSPNTHPVPTSLVGGIRTSPPTPTPPTNTRPISPGIQPISPPRVEVGDQPTQPIVRLPEISVTSPSTSDAFNWTDKASIPNQDIATTPATQMTQANANPPLDSSVKTQDDTTQFAYLLQSAALAPISSSEHLTGGGDVPARPALSPPELRVPSPDENPSFQSLLRLPEFEPKSSLVPTPLKSAPTNIGTGWKYLSSLQQALSGIPEGFAPLKRLMNDFGEVIGAFEAESEAGHGYAKLKKDIEGLFKELSTHISGKDLPSTMTEGMNSLCMVIQAELIQISEKQELSKGRRLQQADQALVDIMNCYQQIQRYLERLKLNAQVNMLQIAEEQRSETWLKSLLPSMSACYNSAQAAQISRRECTPATRKQVLSTLDLWRHDEKQGNMYWLNGMAGTGKTTIATSLCAMLDKSHELGASFFCTRLLPECRNVNLILPTIAYQLARFSYPLYRRIFQALQRDPDLQTKSLSNQLEGLIIGPLREVSDTLPPNFVVVIDALDECEDGQGVGQLLEILAKSALDLPLKIFVSSRPEPQIRQKIGYMGQQLILHQLEDSIVKEDIKIYLQVELKDLTSLISNAELATLVKHAGVLFIYAATIIRYIKSTPSAFLQRKRVETVLNAAGSGPPNMKETMNLCYSTILSSAFGNSDLDPDERTNMKLVLDTVVCAQEPLTVTALAKLLGLEDREWVKAAVEPLRSVLQLSGNDDLVTTLHASFPDYMLDPERSGVHGCQKQKHHGLLTELCFDRIKNNQLQFNVCGLKSSFVFDNQVPDFEERVRQAIPPDLSYACFYWAVHLELGGYSDRRPEQLLAFLSERLLLWMELLNLKNKISASASMLATAQVWSQGSGISQNLKEMIHDAWRFAVKFATGEICQSTPHLYVSMLASWPSTSPLADHYLGRTSRLATIKGPGMGRRQLALLSAFLAGGKVRAVAISPNGMHIVSGCADMKICIWDATSGKLMMDPLEGHTSEVLSVAFSPDGTRIVSGSDDNTICVWDATNGQPVMGLLQGHTGAVRSVSFSPKAGRIVSGSEDTTIHMWDATSGEPVVGPLEGHTSTVYSVAFSSDGKLVASGSEDSTIRMWDATDGKSIMSPLEGHDDAVFSVAFSPDGTQVVSGSADMTVRVWDATSGNLAVGPFEGHINTITSVAFSPDGMRIVSGSMDNEIRVWDTATGNQMMGPLVGPADWVNSVTFSPDGMRIVSGSGDKIIRVWDATGVQPTMPPLKAHVASVNSVAFSPDGRRIATGSGDGSICIWDATSGELMVDPLEGHTGRVFSVSFSPDGTRIVSGADDRTVRVWDAMSGEQPINPLVGHTAEVSSVTFSPDGMHIVSGSWDNTIRAWDATSGELVTILSKEGSPARSPASIHNLPESDDVEIPSWEVMSDNPVMDQFEGQLDFPLSMLSLTGSSLEHEGGSIHGDEVVCSLAFSPNSMCIASGSNDCSVYLWDVRSRNQVMDPLQGHTGVVFSVAFSPDGRCIASGSGDNTVRLWDATSGEQVIGPLVGHTEAVCSVAFSPDGMRIASGSNDNTIRVWDAITGELVMGPLEGHADSVNSVAFSPDGMHIVSGSIDATTHMWNVGTATRQLGSHEPSYPVVNRPWTLDKNGWVRDDQQRLLLWIPADLQSILLRPQDVFLIARSGTVELDTEGAHIGESWVECYVPACNLTRI